MVNQFKFNNGLIVGNQSVITEEYEYELQPKGWKLQKLPIYGEDFIMKNIENAFKPSPSKKKVTLLVPNIEAGEASPKTITPDEYPTFIQAVTQTNSKNAMPKFLKDSARGREDATVENLSLRINQDQLNHFTTSTESETQMKNVGVDPS